MSTEPKTEFEKSTEQKEPSIVAEFFAMLKHNRKYWLIPVIAALLILGLIVILGGTAIAPFIYTIF
jgi:hypothetical protein